ncbi:MAG: hypothetical protein DWQ10_09510 [Calditrichaeota bacterium]|nr:MAG: hypothetical protein DWQ10_09510 [Calditrichota bacterium]
MRYILSVLLVALSLTKCQQGPNKKVITDDQFEDIYIEAIKIYAQTDSVYRTVKIDSILTSKQLSFEDIRNKIRQYNQSPKIWIEFFDKVTQDLREAANKETKTQLEKE